MLGNETRNRGVNVVKAEDIEKGMSYEEDLLKGTHHLFEMLPLTLIS